MTKSPHMDQVRADGLGLEEVVIRRTGAVERIREQLLAARDGGGRNAKLFEPRKKPLVIYASPLVDVAGNAELADETIAACLEILELTPWDIRLLSKSHLLPRIASHIPVKWMNRLIYGVSTGTLDDKLAKSFEQGTALVKKRIESLHWLQDNGFRTFAMICPSLPMENREAYERFAFEMYSALRGYKCETAWAEVLNVRGDSMTRTVDALNEAGYQEEALRLAHVSQNKEAWEKYSRDTFLAHALSWSPDKLRFLQYTTKSNIDWWKTQEKLGAVLLGKASETKPEPALT